MQERLEKIAVFKVALSILSVIILTALPIIHISYAPRMQINQTGKIGDIILFGILFLCTYGVGIYSIIDDIVTKLRKQVVNNKGYVLIWIVFVLGALLMDALLGKILERATWVTKIFGS